MAEQIIQAERMEQIINVFGSLDENIRIIEQEFGVTVINRDTELKVSGEDEAAQLAAKVLEGLIQLAAKGESIGEQNVRYVIGLVREGQEQKITELTKDVICITAKGKPIKAKTHGPAEVYEGHPDRTPSPWVWVLPVPAKPTWRWPRQWPPSGPADGEPDHSYPSGGGGRGAAGLFAGRYAEQGRPLSAAPV